MGLITITRRYLVQAMHELKGIEGLHGHHMYVEVTGRDVTPDEIDVQFREHVQARLNGRDISQLLDAPTGEAMAQWIHRELLRSPLKTRVVAVHLQETEKNRFTSSLTESRYV